MEPFPVTFALMKFIVEDKDAKCSAAAVENWDRIRMAGAHALGLLYGSHPHR
jgi:hypothetical protein